MDSKEVIRRLERGGFELVRINGSHHRFAHADGRRVTVPHPRKDMPTGTLRSIFNQAGWTWPPK